MFSNKSKSCLVIYVLRHRLFFDSYITADATYPLVSVLTEFKPKSNIWKNINQVISSTWITFIRVHVPFKTGLLITFQTETYKKMFDKSLLALWWRRCGTEGCIVAFFFCWLCTYFRLCWYHARAMTWFLHILDNITSVVLISEYYWN